MLTGEDGKEKKKQQRSKCDKEKMAKVPDI